MYGSKKHGKGLQMCSDEYAIRLTDVSKCYNIYSKPVDRLKQAIVPRILSLAGKSLRKPYYREFWALRGLSLSIKKGETFGVIGRNGSGKSTLLQMICGTLTPTSGNIETKGRITALLELGSGFNPSFTGRENVFLNGAILGLSHDEVKARFEVIAEFADIGEFIEQPVRFYSSGMRVRLAFAVQAMVEPDILIIDEALAVGDERFQRKCFNHMEKLKKNGTTILFVSHSVQQIIALCDQSLLIEQGKRLLLSDPKTTVQAYQRLIYANPSEQQSLIEEFRHLDQQGGNIENDPSAASQSTVKANKQEKNKIPDEDFYQPAMIPQSTEIYPSQGAQIESINIYNSDGQQVNNLLAGQEYLFEMRGVFLEERESVFIIMHIRATNGITITAIRYPGSKNQFIPLVKKGQKYRLAHKIKMNLTPDVYFSGGGVWSTTEPTCMHRMIDATMLRVLPQTGNVNYGLVDLTTDHAVFDITD